MPFPRDLTLLQQSSPVYYISTLFYKHMTRDGIMSLRFHFISSSSTYFVLTLSILKNVPPQKQNKKRHSKLLAHNRNSQMNNAISMTPSSEN